MSAFGVEERRIRDILSVGRRFDLEDTSFTIEFCGKPTCRFGEPKTDIYVLARNETTNDLYEIKITFKKENADFLENKTNAERAEQLFGRHWQRVIMTATNSIMDDFFSRPLIYKEGYSRTEAGSITLGWKFELMNKSGGYLSGQLGLSRNQVIDVYAGTNLSDEKRNANVNGRTISNSGVADYILMDDSVSTTQEVVDSLIPIYAYVDRYPNIYFACKALNYRTYSNKYDGNRPLAVFVDWSVNNGVLVPELINRNPLVVRGDQVACNLLSCLEILNIRDTDDINEDNVQDISFVYGL